jgi:uncharacterized lipoprotein YajG
MHRQRTSLILGAFAATVLLAACDRPDPARQPKAAAPAPTAEATVPKVSPGVPSATERKDGGAEVQGQVDAKEPAQQKDFKVER